MKNSKVRVLLISPYYSFDSTLGPHDSIILPPLGLEIIASHISDLAEVRILDNRLRRMDQKRVEKIISKFNPHYVGISCNFTSQIYIVYKLASIAKAQGSQVVVGGWHPTVTVDETLSHRSIDIVVRGEGEFTFRELIQNKDPTNVKGLSYKKKGIIIHNPDRPFQELGYLELPSRKLRSFNARNTYSYLGFPIDCIETSRGCPYSCDFCSICKFYKGSYRRRKIADIISEIKSKEFMNHSGFIFITDDNFMVNKKYVMELCNAIISNKIIKYFIAQVRVDSVVNHPDVFKKMAEAGFIYLFLGIESFSDRTLKQRNKQLEFKQIKKAIKLLHDWGYIIHGNIIIGADLDDTVDNLESTITIAKTMDIDIPSFSLLTPFPGTELRNIVKKRKLLTNQDWHSYNWSVPVINYPNLSFDDLKYYLKKAYHEVSAFSHAMRIFTAMLKVHGFKFHMFRLGSPPIIKSIPSMIKILLKFYLNRFE
jgi:radical SAM superfamily enzyme YgiQ (UPF0313 family)